MTAGVSTEELRDRGPREEAWEQTGWPGRGGAVAQRGAQRGAERGGGLTLPKGGEADRRGGALGVGIFLARWTSAS